MNKKILILGVLAVSAVALSSCGPMDSMNSDDGQSASMDGHAAVNAGDYALVPFFPKAPSSGSKQSFAFQVLGKGNKLVTDVVPSFESPAHAMIVRPDLSYFAHEHATFDPSTGTFRFDTAFPSDGPYRIFVDFRERGHNEAYLMVDVPVGNTGAFMPQAVRLSTQNVENVDGYEVRYGFPQTIPVNKAFSYSVSFSKDGQPVTPQKYRGATAHGIMFDAAAQDMIHAHPAKVAGNVVQFEGHLAKPGTYRIFTQFLDQGKLHTAVHTVATGVQTVPNAPLGAGTGVTEPSMMPAQAPVPAAEMQKTEAAGDMGM